METYKNIYYFIWIIYIYLFFVVVFYIMSSLRKSKSRTYDFTNFTDSKGKQMENILNSLTNKYKLTSKEKRDKKVEEQTETEKEKAERKKAERIMKTYTNRQGMSMKKGFVSKSLKKLGNLVGIRGGKSNRKRKTRKNKNANK